MAGKRKKPAYRRSWMGPFVDALRADPNVAAAARAAGIDRAHAYHVKDDDPVFAAAWDDAIAESVDALESRVFLATHDLSTPPAANLAMFLLRAHRPEKYSDKVRAEITGRDGGPVELSAAKAALLRGIVPDAAD